MKSARGNKGFTLVEVMIAALMLGGIAVGVMFLAKQQTDTSLKSQSESDINQFKSEMLSLLSSPNHCNANFANLTTTSPAPTGIKTCNVAGTSNCKDGTGTADKIPVYTTDWDKTKTKISMRTRLSSLSRSFVVSQPKAPAVVMLTTGTLTARLEYRDSSKGTLKTKDVTITVPVITDGTKVTGCPKSWNSTEVQ